MAEIRQHANATTTLKIRKYIFNSPKTVKELSAELSLNVATVRKWKKRASHLDHSHTRHNLHQSMTPLQERVIFELYEYVSLSINDITHIMNLCLGTFLSSNAVGRCIKRCRAVKGRQNPNIITCEKTGRKYKKFDHTKIGYIHIDLKQLTNLQGRISYIFVAIERNSRYVWVELFPIKKWQP